MYSLIYGMPLRGDITSVVYNTYMSGNTYLYYFIDPNTVMLLYEFE